MQTDKCSICNRSFGLNQGLFSTDTCSCKVNISNIKLALSFIAFAKRMKKLKMPNSLYIQMIIGRRVIFGMFNI